MWLAWICASQAASLSALLAKGEVSLLETYPDGRLKQVTAIAHLDAPVEAVWAVLVDFPAYELWMPKVKSVNVQSSSATEANVEWNVAVVGPDIKFVQHLVMDSAAHTIVGTHAGGAMPGSRWNWALSADGEGTLVERTVRVNVVDSSWFIKQIEDEQHTLDYGINSAIGVVELRGLARKMAAK